MADNAKGGAMRIDTKLVRELAELLDSNGLTEIEVEDGDRKIKVCRAGTAVTPAAPATMTHVPAPKATASAPADSTASEQVAGNVVKSPMVGTAYLSPEPGTKAFVSVGDTVKADDTLMIIEAMKVMNPITAPVAGKVSQLLIGDAQPVEFDQPLAVIG